MITNIYLMLFQKGNEIMVFTDFADNKVNQLRHDAHFIIRNNGGEQYKSYLMGFYEILSHLKYALRGKL